MHSKNTDIIFTPHCSAAFVDYNWKKPFRNFLLSLYFWVPKILYKAKTLFVEKNNRSIFACKRKLVFMRKVHPKCPLPLPH